MVIFMNKKRERKILLISLAAMGIIVIVLCTVLIKILLFVPETGNNSSSSISSKPATNSSNATVSKNSAPPSSKDQTSSKPANSISNKIRKDAQQVSETDSIIESTDNDFNTKNWFLSCYETAERQYISELNLKKPPLQAEIEKLQDEAAEYSTQKLLAERQLAEKYSNMGLLDSGAYQTALTSSRNYYNNKISACEQKISAYRNEITSIENEIKSPDVNHILAIIATNNNLTAHEVSEYYEKYLS